MADEMEPAEKTRTRHPANSGGSPIYALGVIGALVFYWRRADGGTERLAAVGKALVWPAFVVHGLLSHLARQGADLDQ